MTDKEKVLAKFPIAYCQFSTWENAWLVFVGDDVVVMADSGPTESEAWANAAKGLE